MLFNIRAKKLLAPIKIKKLLTLLIAGKILECKAVNIDDNDGVSLRSQKSCQVVVNRGRCQGCSGDGARMVCMNNESILISLLLGLCLSPWLELSN